jgi:hypothetical protein
MNPFRKKQPNRWARLAVPAAKVLHRGGRVAVALAGAAAAATAASAVATANRERSS